MTALVDTNVLVYRFDPRGGFKQERATDLLRAGAQDGSIVIPYQALVEFVAATTRNSGPGGALLSAAEAHQEVDLMLAQFTVLYPSENTFRTALRGASLYRLPWFDALIWAYADERGLDTLWSEDFQHNGLYGRVRAQNPFALAVHEPEQTYGRAKRAR